MTLLIVFGHAMALARRKNMNIKEAGKVGSDS